MIHRAGGFLGRLRRDVAGNTLAIMAAMLIPLTALAGSAVDMARLYTVKTRLQQACDVGVLVGRKQMDTTSSSSTLDTTAYNQAKTFFNNNFPTGWFRTTNVTFEPLKTNQNQVSGTASATVPMAIMGMFNQSAKTLSVSCEARYDVADTDVMFVLDVTGSMACDPSTTKTNCDTYDGGNIVTNSDGTNSVTETSSSRISGVRAAVLKFYDTVTGQADSSTNFRFGFLPFSASVNVGKLLQPLGYMATQWTYQSREVDSEQNSGSPTAGTDTSKNKTQCQAAQPVRSPATAQTYDSNDQATVTSYTWSNNKCATSVQTVIPVWKYKPKTYPVGSFLTSTIASQIDNPAQANSATSYWRGCIEERDPTNTTRPLTPSASSPPLDIDVDTAPTGSASTPDKSYWGPMWPDVEFARLSLNETSSAARTILDRPNSNSTAMTQNYARTYEQLSCPLEAKRLNATILPANSGSTAKAAVKTSIQNYMLASNGFRPWGTTYLDAGMTWGTRLISPSGIFASDTSTWPGHNPPNRFLIFLTDGTMDTDEYAYTSHGMEKYDGRVCNGCTQSSTTSSDTYHNNRFATACQIAKNRNITVFVILFGNSVTALPPLFTACASPGQAFYASDTTKLDEAFAKIAAQVAMLRVSR